MNLNVCPRCCIIHRYTIDQMSRLNKPITFLITCKKVADSTFRTLVVAQRSDGRQVERNREAKPDLFT